jgi:Cdc6-like AAA superfamily ATPase
MQKYTCFPHNDVLDFWIKNNLNVLYYGRHGVGKTSIVIESFKRNNLNYQMFSCINYGSLGRFL